MKKFLFISFIFIYIFFPLTQVKAAEKSRPVRILLVPGHDDEVWGAQYSSVKEADMNLALATEIFKILSKDKRFDVHITRDKDGYTKEFADYFSAHQEDIFSFKENAKKDMQNKIASGAFIQKENPPHHNASEDVAIRLYGFNKWADENNIDAMIHIHFNDYPRAKSGTIGKYTGFVVYYPEGQMANFLGSAQLAADIFSQLHKKYKTSSYEKEFGGLIPDQTLIALGSNGTLLANVRSVLVEYGYIYEKKFRKKATRLQVYKDMGNLTALGIKNYFFPKIK